MVFTDNAATSSATPHETDDISLFLRQLLNRSSSTSSSSTPSTMMRTHAGDHLSSFSSFPPSSSTLPHLTPGPSAVFSGSDSLVVDRISYDALNGVVFTPLTNFHVSGGSNLSSESLTGSVPMKGVDNNNDYNEDFDYESEEGPEMVVEEAGTKQPQSRNLSKRSRAAEVHNLSEKRRRSRINEKMKALQNLIPNSNKTDKASMLDEAIEYLKQLQLQVQMLSMRNGLSLHPMCLPGEQGILYPSQLPRMGMQNLNNSSGSFDINMTNALNMTPDTSDSMFNLANECGSAAMSSVPSISTAISSQAATFGLESSIQANFKPFQIQNCSQAGPRERSVPLERLVVNKTEIKPLVSAMPLPFDTGDSAATGQSPFELRNQQIYGPQEMLLENISGQNQRISSNFSYMQLQVPKMTS